MRGEGRGEGQAVAEQSATYTATPEAARARTEQSFLVPKSEIAANDYDLSINRYKQVVYEEVKHEPPQKILAELKALEAEILKGMEELEGML
jgi:type I restriction enzyme M protein